MYNKILGVLYGMAIGDSMGMPPELWSRDQLIDTYGFIDMFLDGHPDNVISYQYKAGNYTDDTSMALVLLDSLISTDFKPNEKDIVAKFAQWATRENAFEMNILGPTTKVILEAKEKGMDTRCYSDKALTNGSSMRIPPIGTLFDPVHKTELCDYVANVSQATHSSDIAIAGAAMIAMAVSSAISGNNIDKIIEDALSVENYALSLGAPTPSPSIGKRVLLGLEIARRHKNDKTAFLQEIYEVLGTTTNISESVPAALSIFYYSSGNLVDCAVLCANLGGDTDTIGAMACAICGAICGIEQIPTDYINIIDGANDVDFQYYAQKLILAREVVI